MDVNILEAMKMTNHYAKRDVVLRIVPDKNPENPREWDNLGSMICWHRKYRLGDEHSYKTPFDFIFALAEEVGIPKEEVDLGCEAMDDAIEKLEEKALILPIYLYDHSGIMISTDGFRHVDPQRWDWGQVGFIYATNDKLRKELLCSGAELSPLERKHAEQLLIDEVRMYNDYITGDVWGYKLIEVMKCPMCNVERESLIDCMYGFYGSDPDKSGLKENIPEDYRDQFDKAWEDRYDN